MPSRPSLSIVVEWENAKNADARRGRAMLASLTDQLTELAEERSISAELILVYDAADTDAAEIDASLGDAKSRFPGTIHLAPCQGLDYYEQKNFGARQAVNETILLLDCDVIPSPAWLRNLLDCYVTEQADVVCGATHIEQGSLYQKAFALFWFFPLASDVQQRREVKRFFANNVLFRAALLKERPFPDAKLVRGRCRMLADALSADHRRLMIEPAAKVMHPPPNGPVHFIKRALSSGQDDARTHGHDGLSAAFGRYYRQTKAATKRILTRRREVGLSRGGALGAVCIAATYFGLIFTGEVISLVNPDVIRNRLRV